ncbi:MAG: hypothetical protein IT364_27380 [Candidatus Hydrogenedentes bacterium]|nr:hypothetical protein [Candidatus Hydrogenedentota bacterium]
MKYPNDFRNGESLGTLLSGTWKHQHGAFGIITPANQDHFTGPAVTQLNPADETGPVSFPLHGVG